MSTHGSSGSPSGQSLTDLLQSVKHLSDLHARGLLFSESEAGSANRAEHLARLRAKKEEIKALLNALQTQSPDTRSGGRTPDPWSEAGGTSEAEESLYENTGPTSRFALIKSDPPPPPIPPRAPRGSGVPPPLPTSASPAGSTPRDESPSDRQRRLQLERDHLKQLLVEDSAARDQYYSELEVLSKKIRSLSIVSASNYSLDNEAERQKLEHHADTLRIQNSQGLQRRQNWVASLKRVNSEIQELELLASKGVGPRRPDIMADLGGGRAGLFHPRSVNLEQLYHEALPSMNKALSHSGPAHLGGLLPEDSGSVMSFSSSIHSVQDSAMSTNHSRRREDIDNKIECVNSLVSLLGCTDIDKMSRTFEAMSSSAANCELMRSHRVVPLLVQLLHGNQVATNERPSKEVRFRVAKALYNIVQAQTSHPNEKASRKKEAKILKLLENLRLYADFLRDLALAIEGQQFPNCEALVRRGCQFVCIKTKKHNDASDLIICDISKSPESSKGSRSSLLGVGSSDGTSNTSGTSRVATFPSKNFINYSQEAMLLEDNTLALPINIEETMAVLTRCSFDESHRQPISLLGGIPALAELIQVERAIHGDLLERTPCSEVRRYAVVALTNLTFGNASIKSFLCSSPGFIPVMVHQLNSPFENLRKATAHLFRNLAWKADKASKNILSESNVVSVLLRAAMDVAKRLGEDVKEEATLKVVLSALWNLSAHCGKNKADICSMDGALPFLVHLIQSDSVAVVENGGGILRNISSYIATCNDGEKYRSILRDQNCLHVLLQQLKSPSLTIVSNACGTLWNFSARCPEDQHALWNMDAVPMLKSLTNSKHKTIATCSSAALKNLTATKPPAAMGGGGSSSSSTTNGTSGLEARRRRNMMVELDDKLTETCDNVEGNSSEESGSDDEEKTHRGQARSESRGSASSTPSVSSNYAELPPRPPSRKTRPPPPVPEDEEEDLSNGMAERLPLELSKSRKQLFMKPMPGKMNYPSYPDQGEMASGSSHSFFASSSSSDFQTSSQSFQGFASSPMVNNFLSPEGGSSVGGERVMSASKVHLFQTSFHEQHASGAHNDMEDEDDMDERPRDYSLRFKDSEDPDIDGRLLSSSGANKATDDNEDDEANEDTVKTFCTEGTPYDTPCLISTATSMSDLRDPDLDTKVFHKRPQKSSLTSDAYQPASGTFSGMETPCEKPQVFNTEGTPGFFSRADSLSSLGSEDVQDSPEPAPPTVDEGSSSPEKGEIEANTPAKEPESRSLTPTQGAEGVSRLGANKQVTFNHQDTPMMFSRCSSFESLNSFEQHSIKDGYSSCDFSRATSGRVSPSDLPDSPCQTPPPPASGRTPAGRGAEKESHHHWGGKALGLSAVDGTAVEEEDRGSNKTSSKGTLLPAQPPAELEDHSGDQTLETSKDSEEEEIYAETLLSNVTKLGMPNETSKMASGSQSRPDSRRTRHSGIPVKAAGAAPKGLFQYPRSSASSCYEAPRQFATEDTPITLSQAVSNTNLSSLACDDEDLATTAHDTSGEKTDDSDLDIENIIMAGMTSKSVSKRSLPLGERGTGEGAPSAKSPTMPKSKYGAGKKSKTSAPHSSSSRSNPNPSSATVGVRGATANVPEIPRGPDPRFMIDTPISERSRHPSVRGRGGTTTSSNLTSGRETPVHFATEGTPHVFSRCDSLSSLSCTEEQDDKECGTEGESVEKADLTLSSKRSTPSSAGVFRSHLPRPQALGRSESSGSSTKSCRTDNASPEPDKLSKSGESDDDEELMACVINIGMPKSKSEPLDLKDKVVKREKKASSKHNRRSTSKSPRNSKVIPGVRIAELKLKPRSTSQEKESLTLPLTKNEPPTEGDQAETPVSSARMSQIWSDESPNCAPPPTLEAMAETLLASAAQDLSNEDVLQMEAERVSQCVQEEASMISSVCSTLSAIQPPSLMLESLMSISGEKDRSEAQSIQKINSKSPVKKSSPTKLECRHTISAKKGFAVPEMVRRALGVGHNPVKDGSNEDLSSLSSCQSNLDNIKPPTLMEDGDMDNSMMSLASLSSEMADLEQKMGSSNETNAESMDSERIFELARPGAQAAERLMRKCAQEEFHHPPVVMTSLEGSCAQELLGIEPPTIMEEVSGAVSSCTKTLVPHEPEDVTYVIEANGIEQGQSTCHDITDVFDDDTTLHNTFTLGSDHLDDDEAPELPRDSRQTTPAQSGGESSLENTPKTKRKASASNLNIEYYKQYRVPIPDLDDSSETAGQETSGYKSGSTSQGEGTNKSWVQRRKEDQDRFKTHTISKSDLLGSSDSSNSNSPHKRSPRSIKQKREEDGDRFKTHVITPADIPRFHPDPTVVPMSPMEVKLIAEDAQLVVQAITSTKTEARSRSSSIDLLESRGRSASTEILDERRMKLSNDFSGSEPSLSLEVNQIPRGPRVCKPWEGNAKMEEEISSDLEIRAIRGRRKPLYSTPPKRSTIPPTVAPKPLIAPKPRTTWNATPQRQSSPPTQIRGTRASNLRQVNTRGRMSSPPSPKLSTPRSRGSISSMSSVSSKASTVSSRSTRSTQQRPPPPVPMIRQGTFTKDDSSSSPNQSGPEDGVKRIPPRVGPKPMIRRDVIHPVGQRPPVSAIRSVARMPSADRSRAQMSAPDLKPRTQRIGQTRTSQMRERSSSRSSRVSASPRDPPLLQRYPSTSSTSSHASTRSVRSGLAMRTSNSSHSLKSGTTHEANRMTKRVPSSSSINSNPSMNSTSNISEVQSEIGTPGTGPKKPKKEVTSRIASLWKKVEDSKKKNKECNKDPRVWIAQGKVIPEAELALLRPHEEQKQIISNFQAQKQDHQASSLARTEQSNVEVKPRSRSRLSMRLSKFAKPKKDKDSKTPTSPPMSPSTPFAQDNMNGNSQTVTPTSPIIDVDNLLGNGEHLEEIDATNDNDLRAGDEDGYPSKRRSRLGTFLNPESNGGSVNAIQFRSPNSRSPASAAIVPPFNYNPPEWQPPTDPHIFVRPKPVMTAAAAAHPVRRNDSYVSSMGRTGGEAANAAQVAADNDDPKMEKSTSSVMVTLV